MLRKFHNIGSCFSLANLWCSHQDLLSKTPFFSWHISVEELILCCRTGNIPTTFSSANRWNTSKAQKIHLRPHLQYLCTDYLSDEHKLIQTIWNHCFTYFSSLLVATLETMTINSFVRWFPIHTHEKTNNETLNGTVKRRIYDPCHKESCKMKSSLWH